MADTVEPYAFITRQPPEYVCTNMVGPLGQVLSAVLSQLVLGLLVMCMDTLGQLVRLAARVQEQGSLVAVVRSCVERPTIQLAGHGKLLLVVTHLLGRISEDIRLLTVRL